jgi:hypothetical protein
VALYLLKHTACGDLGQPVRQEGWCLVLSLVGFWSSDTGNLSLLLVQIKQLLQPKKGRKSVTTDADESILCLSAIAHLQV